jgi:predicted glycoside hydrolase/deacetylase ChbG (UPF0249 family)
MESLLTDRKRILIVNADDFGLSNGVNEGILRALNEGILRSTSLMVRAPAAYEAAKLAQAHPALGVGLHFDIGEWTFRNGSWEPLYLRVSPDDSDALEAELSAQLERFEALAGRAPTHVDSHQHVHQREPLRSIVLRRLGETGIPVRHVTRHAVYCGDFYGQDERGAPVSGRLSTRFLSQLIGSLTSPVTELCCHPAARVDFEGSYKEERLEELRVLCDPVLSAAIDEAGLELGSFASLLF